ncbi:MAG: hypothetical protein AB7L76_21185 [Burkholderiaceae bacterium]
MQQTDEPKRPRSFHIHPDKLEWEGANYNLIWEDGREYGRFRRVLRRDAHGLTIIARFVAPPGKAWRIMGRAPELGEEVYILKGAYYDKRGRVVAPEGSFMYNAPGALHGGISTDLTLLLHWCSGKPDEIVSAEMIDFEPAATSS